MLIGISTRRAYRLLIVFTVFALTGCGQGETENNMISPIAPPTPPAPSSLSASISFNISDPGTDVNRALLGNNIQWVNNGDGLVSAEGAQQPAVVTAITQMGVTVLRYPGGSLTDSYHWQDGIGAIESRGSNRDLINNFQKIIFGTDEFLQLSSDLNAIPLITVNVNDDPQNTADWVSYVNNVSERVQYWEIANEPYLIEENRPDLAISPEVFASRADLTINAMKNADAAIKVGLPLRSDSFNGIAATPYPGYNNTVLSNVTNHIDFVSVHNAYLPFVFNQTSVSDQDLYASAMAASKVMVSDLDATALQVKSLRSEDSLPIAITEYNALFGLSSTDLMQRTSSLAGALYVADILSILVKRNDILFANIWSLSDNGYFGVVDDSGNNRPAYYVLQAFSRLLQGKLIPSETLSPTFTNIEVGVVPAGTTPIISAIVTRLNKTLRVTIINKHSVEHVELSMSLINGEAINGSSYWQLTGDDLFAGTQGYSPISFISGSLQATGTNLVLDLPPHSFTLYEIPLL